MTPNIKTTSSQNMGGTLNAFGKAMNDGMRWSCMVLGMVLGLGLVACRVGNQVPVPCAPAFSDSWGMDPGSAGSVERAWPGADWHATRQEDWRVRNSGIECVNSVAGTAGRTLALLTHTIAGPILEPVKLSVRAASLAEGVSAGWKPGAHAGLLFGIGGPDVHYKRSALVQQAPAADGGWLLSVNHAGRLRISSFHDPLKRAGYWTLPRGVDFDALPVLAEADERVRLDQGPIEFRLVYEPYTDSARLGLGRLRITAAPALVSDASGAATIQLDAFAESDLVGNLSLFSALGAVGSRSGFGFSDFEFVGAREHAERSLGPIFAATYLVDRSQLADTRSTLRLTAHLAALGAEDSRQLRLWLESDGGQGDWQLAARAERTADGSDLACFTVEHYQDREDGEPRAYIVEWVQAGADSVVNPPVGPGLTNPTYGGHIRAEPAAGDDWVLASLSCLKNQVGPIAWNQSGLWFPHEELTSRVLAHDPDFLYFSGDQIYEGDLTGPNRKDLALSIADYQTKYRRFLWAFSDLLRDRPSVLVPDDHDVFHGNLWGAGGIQANKRDGLTAQDAGGYRMPAAFVNVVHASLTRNLPPSKVSPLIGQGITTYTTDFTWGGVDFAVLADRMWKDSPSVMAPKARFRNGWIQADGADAYQTDNPEAHLLGEEQEQFMEAWAQERKPLAWTKVVLSQSPFACLHSLPASTKSDEVVGRQQPPAPGVYPIDDAPVADGDSNGWPQSARTRAVALLAKAGALHLCGDQHLGTVSWYGLDRWREGTVAFTSPAMGNTWPRRWMPSVVGRARPTDRSGKALTPRYTGDYRDGFGNRITMLAVANPEANGREPVLQMNRAPGFGIVRFQPAKKRIALEAWPTWETDEMYPGWPVYVTAEGRPTGGGW
ncbi:MAG: hypothetical protein ACI89E_000617 [Planctomycetota bacterium]|jgi:hypothetical protein